MKFFKILRKYLEKFGPWATIWANGPLQFSNPKTGPGLGQNDSAQAHSGPNPKIGFTKARARPGRAWAWPKLIPTSKFLLELNLNVLFDAFKERKFNIVSLKSIATVVVDLFAFV